MTPRDWALTQEAFDGLLAFLDPDREHAGHAYERIRTKLAKFFQWRGCSRAEEYVDQTINRVARRIAEGATVQVTDPYTYFHGVALNVLKEYWRQRERDPEHLVAPDAAVSPSSDPVTAALDLATERAAQRRTDCLRRCLAALSAEARRLVTEYHRPGDRIERRKKAAEELGIHLNALRIRVFRIRTGLLACVDKCMGLRSSETNLESMHS